MSALNTIVCNVLVVICVNHCALHVWLYTWIVPILIIILILVTLFFFVDDLNKKRDPFSTVAQKDADNMPEPMILW